MAGIIAQAVEQINNTVFLRSLDESATKQGVVLRLLSLCGWNQFDLSEVSPEYTVGNRRVDYALMPGSPNAVFIEVKRPSESLEGHQQQLLGYCFQEGVKLAALTNGRTWWLYLPLQPGSWEQRRFLTIDLESQEPDIVERRFMEYLSKGMVTSGQAVSDAEDVAVWSAIMTVESVYQGYGYYSTDTKKAGSLSPASFEVDGTTYTVKMVETQGWMYIGVDRELPFDFVLELDGERFASSDASFRSYSYGNIYRWERTGLRWRDGDTVEVRLLRAFEEETAVNSPATGAPTVSGAAQVGETLTAGTSGIADEDGLENVSFNYQWLAEDAEIAGATGYTYTLADTDAGKTIKVRVSFTDDADNEETLTSAGTAAVTAKPNSPAADAPTITGTAQVGETLVADTSGIADEDGLENVSFSYEWLADDAEIAGATASTYTLADADEGKAIQVRVSFTDDADNDETLTSAATAVVKAPLTASLENTPYIHDGQNVFTFELRFSEEFSLSYKTLRDHAFTVSGAAVENAERITQGSNVRWRITVSPNGDAQVAVTLPVTHDCDAQGAICTGDGRMLSNELVLTVRGPGDRLVPG